MERGRLGRKKIRDDMRWHRHYWHVVNMVTSVAVFVLAVAYGLQQG